ncbi:MAG: sensor histidine kinase [Solirubrobacteraceae bacterium]
MTEHRSGPPLLRRSELYLPGLILAVAMIVWALTGVGYFWPSWVLVGLAFVLGLTAAARWASRRSTGGSRLMAGVGAVGVVTSPILVLIWLITGAGYFWPAWSMLGYAIVMGLIWIIRRPARRSLEVRVDELTRTRRGVLDVQASELRRIERDLHDGAQARLVALSMQLGRAEERLAAKGVDGSDLALLRQARLEATAAIAELRDLARGIAPPILADRGLEAAVRSLADRSGSEVAVEAELARRPPPAVETAAYFVVAESLTNATKHATGSQARVTLTETVDDLIVEVIDYGPGGASAGGSGLTGLRQRVEALDGRLEIISPAGVGTMIEAVLPCGW